MSDNRLRRILWTAGMFIILIASSCTPYKDVIIYQNPAGKDSITYLNDVTYKPVIQRNDIVDIYVMSTSPEASKYFNFTGREDNVSSMLNGYLVDVDGKIQIPIIGDVHVEGLTSSQARDTITQRLGKYLIAPSVKLNIRNFKVTVIGEVAHAGVYSVQNEKMTLPEALAMAGDITVFSKLDEVTIIRDSAGYKIYGNVNLRTRELFSSPYYALHANDIIYVHPSRKKKFQGENYYRILPVVLSTVTFMLSIATIFTTKN